MKAAKIRISPELLRQMLHFPERTRIIDVRLDELPSSDIVIFVESPGLPELKEGEGIPEAHPEYETVRMQGSVQEIVFRGWGEVS